MKHELYQALIYRRNRLLVLFEYLERTLQQHPHEETVRVSGVLDSLPGVSQFHCIEQRLPFLSLELKLTYQKGRQWPRPGCIKRGCDPFRSPPFSCHLYIPELHCRMLVCLLALVAIGTPCHWLARDSNVDTELSCYICRRLLSVTADSSSFLFFPRGSQRPVAKQTVPEHHQETVTHHVNYQWHYSVQEHGTEWQVLGSC